jgi:hypothetical protein
MAEESWFDPRQEIFLFSATSRPALGPTHLPIQQIPGALYPDVTHLNLVSCQEECVELYLHSPTRVHGVVLNEVQGQLYFCNEG